MAARGVALGAFDMFHVGHLRALQEAAGKCGHLVVAVADDALVEARCGETPLVPLHHRVEVIGAFGLAAEIVVVDSDSAAALVASYAVDLAFVALEGGDAPPALAGAGPARLPLTVIEVASTSCGSLRRAAEPGLLWVPAGALDAVVCT